MDTDASRVVYRALSLGAGVQSSVLALLLAKDDSCLAKLGYPRPDCAIFADTGWEPEYVYQHLDWLETQLSYPLVRVSAGNLKSNIKKGRTASGHYFVDVPLFTLDSNGKKGMLRRQCTNHYKINPIYREVRKLAGGQRGRPFPKDTHVEMWLGISLDEVSRMKPSREPWLRHRWAVGGYRNDPPRLHGLVQCLIMRADTCRDRLVSFAPTVLMNIGLNSSGLNQPATRRLCSSTVGYEAAQRPKFASC